MWKSTDTEEDEESSFLTYAQVLRLCGLALILVVLFYPVQLWNSAKE